MAFAALPSRIGSVDRPSSFAMTLKRHGGRKVIIAPNGGDAWAPTKPRPDNTLIRTLARAHRWKRMLEEGRYRSAAEIAEAEKVSRSLVNRMPRLTLLVPDIVEAILDGRQPKGTAARGLNKTDAERMGRPTRIADLRSTGVHASRT